MEGGCSRSGKVDMEGRGDPNKETSERKEGDLIICKSIRLSEREGGRVYRRGWRKKDRGGGEKRRRRDGESREEREREREGKEGKKSRRERKKRQREGPERSGGRGVR